MSDQPGHAPRGPEPPIKNLFIRRPVLSMVISIVIVLLGLFSLSGLAIEQYPALTPPSVLVSAFFPGASAEDVADAVAAPIEQQLSGLQDLLYFKSSNASDGTMNLEVYFDPSRDQDLAAVDVQNQVKLAEPQLPAEVRRNGVTIKKAQKNILLMVALTSEDPAYDAFALSKYAKINIEDEIKRLPGVGDAYVYGQLEFSMLISLDPDKLARLGLTITDVNNAVQEQNVTNPAGRVGREPAPPGTELTLPVTTIGRLKSPEEFERVILKAESDGSLVHIADVGEVILGSRSYDLVGRLNGQATALVLVYLRSGANALDLKERVVETMDRLERSFPTGIGYTIAYDTTPVVEASIEEVIHTFFEALILVVLVVFVFLQSFKATLIPSIAVPVSILGTFFGMSLMGFSVNSLTLFGMVLAIGIVVDDAIVVVENVEAIMAKEGVSAAVAADKAMSQISGALIAIVLVLCAVFVPVAFMGGLVGGLFKQFAITIAVSVVLSGIVALTLTPALCAMLLKNVHHGEKKGFFGWFNRTFDRITGGYVGNVERVIGRPKTFVACFLVMMGLIVVMFRITPTGFIPTEDKGFFMVNVQLPDGASSQRTTRAVERVENYFKGQEEVANVVSLVGLSFLLNANQPNTATVFVTLKPWGERSGSEHSLFTVLAKAQREFAQINEAVIFGFNLPEIPGLGLSAGMELQLQDRGVGGVRPLAAATQEFIQAANASGEIAGAAGLVRVNVPQVFARVDREKVKVLGLNLTEVFQTLQAMLATIYINDFNLYGKTWRVQAEAQPRFRTSPEDIGKLYVRAPGGHMVPLSAVISTEFGGAPSVVTRFNGFTAIQVTAVPPPGGSSGAMHQAAEDILAKDFAARGVGYGWSGQSYQERVAGGGGFGVVGIGMILVFLVLAAQYESWSIPFAVMLGIPFGILGGILSVWARGIEADVYFQIGLIALVGLAAKNAILIVEFANELRHQGMGIREAALEAARARFRPILMTSFAFILGAVPLVIASGAGARSRWAIGTGVAGGMLFATIVGVFFIPLFFYLIQHAAGGKKPDTPPPAGGGGH
jgi:hydrophobe/amphiphile efflux-1 (HAE1) family protein